MKMTFDYFQIQKWMLQTDRVEKTDEENGVICLVSMFASWVMVLKLSKKVHFLQFCADLSKKPKSVKIIYICVSESSHYIHSENNMVYRGLWWWYVGQEGASAAVGGQKSQILDKMSKNSS